MILTTTAIYPLSISWTRASSSSSSSSSSTRDTIRTTSFIRKPPSLLSLAFLSIVDANTRLARKREREREKEREKVFEKELSLLWSQPLFKGAFSLKKIKELIQLLLLAGADERATATRPNQRRSFATTLFISANSSRKRTSLFCRRRRRATFLSSADVFFSALGKKFPPRAHTTTTKEQRKRETSHEEKKNNQNRRLNRRKPTRHALARPTMNEIGSGAFAFTAALMVSSTRLERLCVSMYSWIDIIYLLFYVVIALFFVTTLPRGCCRRFFFFFCGKKMNKKFLS